MKIVEFEKSCRRCIIREERGQINFEHVYLNLSGIWSLLIKEAAKCESYASDLMYDYETVQENLKDVQHGDSDGFEKWFGFRNYGVDGNSFVESRIGDCVYITDIRREYNALYKLAVQADAESTCGYFTAVLTEYVLK